MFVLNVFNSRKAIVEAIIGLLVLYYSKRNIGFLEVFSPEVLFVRTAFSPKSENEEKLPDELIFSEREKFVDHALRSKNEILTLKSDFDKLAHINNHF